MKTTPNTTRRWARLLANARQPLLVLSAGVALSAFAGCAKDKEQADVAPVDPVAQQFQGEVAFPGQTGPTMAGKLFGKDITYQRINGRNVFGGDVLLPDSVVAPSAKGSASPATESAGRDNHRWPFGEVFYSIDPAMPHKERVTDAIAHWKSKTNIRFRLRSTFNIFAPNYVYFFEGGGCYSEFIGKAGGKQKVSLGAECGTGNAIHEIGHVLGLYHEQSRQDRDNHIVVHYDHISTVPGIVQNFDKYDAAIGTDRGAFDFGSIMLYGSFSFSDSPVRAGRPTMTKKDGSLFEGQRAGLSVGDIKAVNAMYPVPVL